MYLPSTNIQKKVAKWKYRRSTKQTHQETWSCANYHDSPTRSQSLEILELNVSQVLSANCVHFCPVSAGLYPFLYTSILGSLLPFGPLEASGDFVFRGRTWDSIRPFPSALSVSQQVLAVRYMLDVYDKLWGLVMKAGPNVDESESGQMVLK